MKNSLTARLGMRMGLMLVLIYFVHISSSCPAQTCVAQPYGLTGWWQGDGDAADVLGLVNGQVEGGISFAQGKVGRAFVFNGQDADIRVPASTYLDVGAGEGLTVDLWIKPADLNEHPIIEWNNGGFQTHFWMSSPLSSGGGGVGCLYANLTTGITSHTIATVGGLLTTNSLQHIALTFDKASGVACIYLNGALAAQSNLGSFTPDTTGSLYFGLRPAGGGAGMRFPGQMDEIDLFNRALSASEIQSIYDAGAGGKCGVAPVIITQPQSMDAGVGEDVTLSAEITGTRPFMYQWLFQGAPIPGATKSSLQLTNIQTTNAGVYSLVVSNSVGTVVSSDAVLTVIQYSCTPSPDGLASWWQAEGDASDVLGNNNGSLQGGVLFGLGEVRQGFQLDGATGYIRATASPSLNLGQGGGGLTIEGWIRPSNLLSAQPLVEWNNALGSIGVHLWINQEAPYGSGSACIFANLIDTDGNVHYLSSAAGVLTGNSFQHVALTYDPATGNAALFCDGVNVASQSLGFFIPQTSYDFFMGYRPSGPSYGAHFVGGIDEISLYNRPLSDFEILSIYQSRSVGKCLSAPTIFTQPKSQTVPIGNTISFSVVATGPRPFSYQWKRDGTDLTGATSSSLTLTNIQTADSGNYSVVVSNPGGFVTSSNAVLTTFIPTCTSTPTNLTGWWQGEGDASDSSGLNISTAQGNLSFAPGKAGKALNFNGTNAYVSVQASSSLDVGTNGGFTIEGWINPMTLASQIPIAEWNNGAGAYGVHFWISTPAPFGSGPGCLYANLNDTSNISHYISSGPGLVATNVFQHVALTFDRSSGVASIYLNGVSVATTNLGSFIPRTSYNFFLGRRPSYTPQAYFVGAMDEISLYNRALTSSEIQALFNADSAGKCAMAPAVLLQPQSQSVRLGSNATFSAGIKGSRPMAYQWKFNGANIPGATNISLTLSNAQTSQSGNYSITASNALGIVSSSNAALKVNLVTILGNNNVLSNAQYTFGGSVSIRMTNIFSNGYIFYTLDGTAPTFASSQYTGPFVISQNSIIRAVGYSSDFFQFAESDPIGITIVPTYILTTTTPGGGTISIASTNGPYMSNTPVTIIAKPSAGWTFLQWLGDAAGTHATNTIVMNRNETVQAIFGTVLGTTAAGNGSVQLNPLAASYPYGSSVTISAIPQPGNYFALWGNAASGNTNPLVFTITNANPIVSSLFSSLSGGQAALAVVPIGRGRINVNPRANVYTAGQTVTVTATPDQEQSFIGWSVDASGSQNPVSVVMNQSKVIYANFSSNTRITEQFIGRLNLEGVRLSLDGEIGKAYRLEASTNLINWSLLGTFTNLSGTIQLNDFGATNFNTLFYRGKLLP